MTISVPAPDPTGFPDELKPLVRWVAWKAKPRANKPGKIDKVPIDPHTGRKASTIDPRTWGTLEQALARMQSDRLDGVGFVFMLADGFVAIDLDECIDPESGEIAPWATEIIEKVRSFTEFSVSGLGYHVIAKGSLPAGGRKKGHVEMYSTGRFFAMTGQHLDGTPTTIEPRAEVILEVHHTVFGAEEPPRLPTATAPPLSVDDNALVAKAKAAENGPKFTALFDGSTDGYTSPSEADLALAGILAFWTGGDAGRIDRLFRQSRLMRPKWDELRGPDTYGAKTIRKALEGKSKFYKPSSSKPSTNADASAPIKKASTFQKLTDTGNAERLVDQFGSFIRHCHPMKKWLTWWGDSWRYDATGKLMSLSKKVVRGIYGEAAKARTVEIRQAISDWAKSCEKVDRRKALIELAKSEDGIPILPEALDRDPWLLNCRNGTIDLRTGKLCPHRPEDYITRCAPVSYDPNAKCPTWDKFLEDVLPESSVREFVQRAMGYTLTGDVGEQVLFFLLGDGANGKSTFIRAVQECLGPYAIQAAPDILLSQYSRNHPTEIADLFGTRLAVCMEVGVDRSFDEVLIKQLTGGDRLRARRMKEDFWEFDPTHKIVLGANHRPQVKGTDEAIWRRLIVIPFNVFIPEEKRDSDLPEKLRSERAGILAWAVRGCLEWQRDGLKPPQEVRLAVADYRAEMDAVGQFLDERCVRADHLNVGATPLFKAYQTWCEQSGNHAISQREFGLSLTRRGIVRQKQGTQRYLGIALTSVVGNALDHKGPCGPVSDMNALKEPRDRDNTESGPQAPQRPNGGVYIDRTRMANGLPSVAVDPVFEDGSVTLRRVGDRDEYETDRGDRVRFSNLTPLGNELWLTPRQQTIRIVDSWGGLGAEGVS